MRFVSISMAAFAALFALGAMAEEDSPPASPTPAPESTAPAPTETTTAESTHEDLTPEEQAQKAARRACKVELCAIIESKDPNGADVSCDIVKTWREKAIAKMLGGRIDWPWGKAVCRSRLEIKREALAKAMSEPSYAMTLPEQKLRCTLAQKDEGEPYAIEVSIAPKVTFENGKAVEAHLNWGEASAPMLVYALIYAGTGLDNQTNVLGPEVVSMVNGFTTKKCAEVKNELLIKTGN